VRILAIESSAAAASVAVFDDDKLLGQIDLDPRLRSARTLAPALAQIVRDAGWTPADVQLVAAGVGPGSFTGLRLGVMTAKAFAYATGAEILGVGTLDAIAARAPADTSRIAAVIDAQRGELYCGTFLRSAAGAIEPTAAIEILSVEQWIASLSAGCVVTGPALVKLDEQVQAAAATRGAQIAPRASWHPTAEAIGRLAFARHTAGARGDVWQLAPLYLRRSAAEEKAARAE